ncbi:MAG: SusC/RagA family TonB-linked outer membrane protein [Thermoleophilia bacterium]|nr:SusC/RagA family TonB-linked outer membrane protein [Thermoleophilia bacterium]
MSSAPCATAHLSRWRLVLPGLALALALAAVPVSAQTGTIVGRVIDGQSGRPVPTAQVSIAGTQLGALVDAEGRFRIERVPLGTREVRAIRIGYNNASATVTVAAGQPVSVELRMTETAIGLDEIVVTGTAGQTRRRAIGNAVSTVNTAQLMEQVPAMNVTEVLQAKTPGLTIMPGSGTAGTGANFRLRGASSVYANTQPTIYVDGVRIHSGGLGNFDVFGQNTSALDAINPADIESIEVIKGPAAATLYGAEAAAGVIQIITKKGRPGAVSWDARAEYGGNTWVDELRPINYGLATAARIADAKNYPWYQELQVGDIVSHRVMSEPDILRTGKLTKFSLGARGGGDNYAFYVSGGRDEEQGTYYNNFSNRTSLRGNFQFQPTEKMTFSTDVGYSINDVRLPLSDNIASGPIIGSYLAIPGRQYNFPGGLNYSQIMPERFNEYHNYTHSDRFLLGGNAEYKFFEGLSTKVTVGYDLSAGRAEVYFKPQTPGNNPWPARASFNYDNTKGLLAQGRPLYKNLTLDWTAQYARDINDRVTSTSAVGAQYLRTSTERTDTYGQDLGAAGIMSIAAAAVTWGDQRYSEQKSLGFYAQEQVAWRDRVFLTAAVRMDNNSAFGSELNRVFYPKVSGSWVISEEDFFNVPVVDQMRVRAAWGQAGNAPGPFDALRSYTTSVATGATGTSSALRYLTVGNPDLKPERASEIEIGFEAEAFNGRLGLDVSYYNTRTEDALLPVDVAPSTGFSGTQLQNLGTISNQGFEILVNATPYENSFLSWETTLSMSTNKNELVSFGMERAPIILTIYAPVQRYQEGYPLGGYWAQQVKYNADGTLMKTSAGRPMLQDSSIYIGPSSPTREVSFSNTFTLFDRFKIYGLFDYKGGHYLFDVKDWRRDRSGVSWETVNPAADPDEVLVRQFASQTYLHILKADFIKLRDLSVSYDLPGSLLTRIGVRRSTLTVSGHNLKIWTDYRAGDPEVNFSGDATFNRNDSWTVPQTRRISASLTVAF